MLKYKLLSQFNIQRATGHNSTLTLKKQKKNLNRITQFVLSFVYIHNADTTYFKSASEFK